MNTTRVIALARGETTSVTLPSNPKFDPPFKSPKYLSIVLDSDKSRRGVFEVSETPREGAEGIEIYLRPGQLELTYGASVPATAKQVSAWAYRVSQLGTPVGLLVLATFASALTTALIDGSVAIGKDMNPPMFVVEAQTLALLSAISMGCKVATAMMAFLLAWCFKK